MNGYETKCLENLNHKQRLPAQLLVNAHRIAKLRQARFRVETPHQKAKDVSREQPFPNIHTDRFQ